MPQKFSNEDMDRMTADAIRRARQMQMRSSLPQKELKTEIGSQDAPDCESNVKSIAPLNIEKLLGGDNDRIILIILILLLRSEKENLPIILALLYILM